MNLELTWTLINGRSFNSLAAFPPELMTAVASCQCAPPSWSLNHANGLLSCRLSWSTVVPPVPASLTSVDSGYSSPSSPLVPSSSPVPFRLSFDAVSFADVASSADEVVASPPFDASTPVHRPPVPAIGAHVIPPPPAFADSFISTLAISPPPTTSTATRAATPHPPPPAEATTTVDLVLLTAFNEVPPSSDGIESSHVTNKFPEDGSAPTGGQVSALALGSPSAFGDATSEPPASPASTIDSQVPASDVPLLADTTTTAVWVLPPVVSEVPPSSDGIESSHVTNKFPEDGSSPTGGQVSASTLGSPSASGDATSEPPASPTSTIDTQIPASDVPLLADTTTTAVLVLPPVVSEVPPSSDGIESSHVTNKFPEDGSSPTGGQVSASTLGSPSASGDGTSESSASPTSTTDLGSASIACQTDPPPTYSAAPPTVSSMGSQTTALLTVDASTQATALPSATASTSGPHVLLPQPSRSSSRNKKKKKKGQPSICTANSCDAATSYDPPGLLVRLCRLCHEPDCVGSSALVHLLTCTDLPARILALRTTFFDQQAKRIGIPPAVLLTQSALFLTNHYLDDIDPEEFDCPPEDLIGQLLWSTFADPVKIAAYLADLRLLLRNLSTAILKHLQFPPSADLNLLFCTRGCDLLPREADVLPTQSASMSDMNATQQRRDDPFHVNGFDPDAHHPFDDLYSADDPYLDDPYYGHGASSDELDVEEF